MGKGYNIINGYQEIRVRENGVEKIIIQLLEDGKFFTQTTLPGDITEERYKAIIEYLNETFESNDGTVAGALITILSYIQGV